MDDPAAALSTLDASLSSLESALAPLLARSRASTLEALDKVAKAKMDVLLAFAINNLVWVYLRSRGIDPETHDVTGELERIKTYYAKVRSAEAPSETRSRINVPAAARIIAHHTPRTPAQEPPSTSAAASARAQAVAATSVGRSSRFRGVAAEGEKMIPGTAEEEEEMDVDEPSAQVQADNLLDAVEADIVAAEVAEVAESGKGKKKAPKKKRKRAA